MGFIPGFVMATAVILALTLTLLPFLSILFGTKGRSAVALGMRMARGYPSETIARALPVALVVALMIASLSVGDGLFDMVEENVDSNLSSVDHVIDVPSFISQEVCQSSLDALDIDGYAQIIQLDAFPSPQKGDAITLFGVQEGIADLLPVRAGNKDLPTPPDRYDVYINRELASQQGLGKGDTLRITTNIIAGRTGSLLTYTEGGEITLNLTVSEVIDNTGIGRYREDSRDEVDPIAIMDLNLLQERLGEIDHVNKILLDLGADTVEAIEAELDGNLNWEHGGFEVLPAPEAGGTLIRNEDLMFHSRDLMSLPLGGTQTLSYFVDSLSGTEDLSYSVITGLDAEYIPSLSDVNGGPVSLHMGEILLDNWTADRIDVEVGDHINLTYRSVDHIEGFEGTTISLKVVGILPKEGIMAEKELIPSVEGLTGVDSCLDWDPSFDVDIDDISDDDQLYWKLYGSAPKGIITLDMARYLWRANEGDTSAIWFPSEANESEVEAQLDDVVTLSYIGGSIIPVRENALGSSRGMLIFPGMFLTFGSAIIAGALLVFTAVVIDISKRRSRDHSMLKALGFSRFRILTIGAVEGTISILAGALFGTAPGIILGIILNRGINSIWSSSVESASVPFSLSFETIIISISLGILLCVPILLYSIWNHLGKDPASSMNREDPSISTGRSMRPVMRHLLSGVGALAGITLLVLAAIVGMGPGSSALFTLGSILLSSSLALALFGLILKVRDTSDLGLMVSANLSRRPGKVPVSIAVLALTLSLALSLSFVGSILEEDLESDIGSYGGEYKLVVETGSPFTGDLDEITYDIDMNHIAPLLSRGDEGGKCSNINAPFPPRLLGYRSSSDMYNFSLIDREGSYSSDMDAWDGLETIIGGKFPIMVDQNTLQWIYFKGLGDTFAITTEDGREVGLLVVGVLSPSILTGSFVMSSVNLRLLFPEGATYSYFLVDTDDPEGAAETLSTSFSSLSPTITLTDDLARENLDYELSYLNLFRDFLVLGLIVAIASAAVFTHARAATLGRELELLRTIGVKRGRAVQYFFVENLIVFVVATAGALLGSIISSLILSTSMGVPLSGSITPVITISISFLAASIFVSLGSAFWVLRGYPLLIRRSA
ncbi:MAG: ABC transporter permease [Thermoplasmata archaeon]|nr:ABC transporter permease [Thermoplasmata archaeon]